MSIDVVATWRACSRNMTIDRTPMRMDSEIERNFIERGWFVRRVVIVVGIAVEGRDED